jgi:hypothetical protein
MRVEELIELLLKVPKGSLILTDIEQEEKAEIIDVLIGGGTTRGFAYLKIEPYKE